MERKLSLSEQERVRLLSSLAPHLSGVDIERHATDTLSDAERAIVDRHLADCADCRQEVVEARRVVETFDTTAGHLGMDRLWESFVATARAQHLDSKHASGSNVHSLAKPGGRTLHGQPTFPKPQVGQKASGTGYAVAAAGKSLSTGSSADRQLEWQFNELDNGDLEAIFSSTSPEYAGAELVLNTTPARRVVLAQVFSAWMARFVLPKNEWIKGAGQMIERLIFANGEVVTADEREQ